MKLLVISKEYFKLINDVSHWSFDEVWEWLENDTDYKFNPRCIFK